MLEIQHDQAHWTCTSFLQAACTMAVYMEEGDEITVSGAADHDAKVHGEIWSGLSIALIN